MENKYLSIQDFANLVNKSQQGIYKRLKNKEDKLNNYIKLEDGKKLISIEAAKDLYKINIDEIDFDNFGSNREESKTAAADSQAIIEILKNELEIKNKQIDDLNDRLSDLTKTLDQQQQLALIDKKRILELEDKQKKYEEAAAEEVKDPAAVENNKAEDSKPKKWWKFWK